MQLCYYLIANISQSLTRMTAEEGICKFTCMNLLQRNFANSSVSARRETV